TRIGVERTILGEGLMEYRRNRCRIRRGGLPDAHGRNAVILCHELPGLWLRGMRQRGRRLKIFLQKIKCAGKAGTLLTSMAPGRLLQALYIMGDGFDVFVGKAAQSFFVRRLLVSVAFTE